MKQSRIKHKFLFLELKNVYILDSFAKLKKDLSSQCYQEHLTESLCGELNKGPTRLTFKTMSTSRIMTSNERMNARIITFLEEEEKEKEDDERSN